MFNDKECRYEKLLFIATIVIFITTLTACGNKTNKDFNDFDNKLSDVKKSKNVEEVIDKIHLKELDNLSKTDTTDKTKRIYCTSKDINNYLMPEFKKYKKAANQLPANTNDVKIYVTRI